MGALRSRLDEMDDLHSETGKEKVEEETELWGLWS